MILFLIVMRGPPSALCSLASCMALPVATMMAAMLFNHDSRIRALRWRRPCQHAATSLLSCLQRASFGAAPHLILNFTVFLPAKLPLPFTVMVAVLSAIAAIPPSASTAATPESDVA